MWGTISSWVGLENWNWKMHRQFIYYRKFTIQDGWLSYCSLVSYQLAYCLLLNLVNGSAYIAITNKYRIATHTHSVKIFHCAQQHTCMYVVTYFSSQWKEDFNFMFDYCIEINVIIGCCYFAGFSPHSRFSANRPLMCRAVERNLQMTCVSSVSELTDLISMSMHQW